MKSTGGPIRSTENLNRRVQDGFKTPLLCKECEKQFSAYETLFANKIFYPYNKNYSHTCNYGDWLLKFSVSVSWRVLLHFRSKPNFDSDLAHFRTEIDSALSHWRDFLTNSARHPGKHEQHILLFAPIAESSNPNVPNNIHRYALRAIQIDILHSEHELIILSKLGPFFIFGAIKSNFKKWKGTKVRVKNGRIGGQDLHVPMEIMQYIFTESRKISEMHKNISENQNAKISDHIMNNIEKFADSEHFRAILNDYDLFGEDAVIRE